MLAPTYPASASKHYRRLQRLQATTVAAMRRVWRRMEPLGQWQTQYAEDVGPKMTLLMLAAQVAAVRESDAYVAELLAELDLVPDAAPGVVNPAGFAGVAGDGRPVESLLAQSVPHAGRAYNAATKGEAALSATIAQPAEQALDDTEKWLEMVAQTIIADAARAAESAVMTTHRDVGGYVRMLSPPSCSRCAILAGKFYRWNDGFERHPRCDCVHIPASEADYGDLRVNPDLYFESLPSAADLADRHPELTVQMRRDLGLYSQEDMFTVAGARAIRDGADLSQVVNARRGMHTAQQNVRGWIAKGRLTRNEFGTFTTTEGTTRRGRGNRSRTGRNASVRLMPESIYEIAKDRDDAIRLLKLNGFIF